jgi:hypothetical protein
VVHHHVLLSLATDSVTITAVPVEVSASPATVEAMLDELAVDRPAHRRTPRHRPF